MKLQIPLWLVIACAVVGLSLWAASQIPTSRFTSDASQTRGGLPMPPMPSQRLLFVPPNDMIHVEFHTSTIPLVVRVEVSSNVWRRTVWFNDGQAQTNESLMASNLVSAVTNEVVR